MPSVTELQGRCDISWECSKPNVKQVFCTFFKTANKQLTKPLQPSTIGAYSDYNMDFEI